MEKAYIFDIDDTLSNTEHRQHLAVRGDWEAFYAEQGKDTPTPLVRILNTLACTSKIILLTGRPERYRDQTLEWLRKHNITFDYLKMRPTNKTFIKDAVLKESIYCKDIKPFYEVLAVFEDRKQCVDMWRALGLCCLQPKESNF